MNAVTAIERPRQLSPERYALAEQVIERIYEHGNMSRACRELSVAPKTFYDWLDLAPDLSQRYTRARKIGTAIMVDDGFDKATDPKLGPKQVGKARLAWDATRWLSSKQDPDTYGDKTRTELTGANGAAIEVSTQSRDPIVSELAALLRQAKRPAVIEGTAKRIEPPSRAPDDISDLI